MQHVPICVLALVVPFFIGFLQMRAINFRGVLAALFGLITPFWIVIGLGLIDPTTALLPAYGQALEVLTEQQIPAILIGLALVGVFTFVFMTINVMKSCRIACNCAFTIRSTWCLHCFRSS